MQLTQVRLLVDDFPRVFRFYRDVLGLTPQVDDERGPYAKLSPDTGDAAIALHRRSEMAALWPELGTTRGDQALLVLKVTDVDRAVDGIRARGGQIAHAPIDAFGRMRVAYLRDPEGNAIELQQWLVARS